MLSWVSTVSAGCDASADTTPAKAPLASDVPSLTLRPRRQSRVHKKAKR